MNVAVLIPTLGRRSELVETLASVAVQSSPVRAAVIVDASAPSERTETRRDVVALALPFPVTYLETDRVGMTVQRNIALAHVPDGTDVILWLDDDVVLDRDHVRELMRVFIDDRSRRVGAVAGVFQSFDRSGLTWWFQSYQRLFLLTGRAGSVLPSGINVVVESDARAPVDAEWLYGCAAYRVEAISGLRFDEGLGRYALLEDVDYSFRVGRRWRLIVTPRARLLHKRSPAGRVSARELERLHVRNRLRFLRRNSWTPFHAIAFAWSTLGILLMHVFLLARTRRSEYQERAAGTLEGIALCLRGDHLRPSLADGSVG